MMNLPDLGVGITFSLELESFVRENLDILSVLIMSPRHFGFILSMRTKSTRAS